MPWRPSPRWSVSARRPRRSIGASPRSALLRVAFPVSVFRGTARAGNAGVSGAGLVRSVGFGASRRGSERSHGRMARAHEVDRVGHAFGLARSTAGARAFRFVCTSLSERDHAAGAVAALRSFAPGPDLEASVQTGLLRLTEDRREAYRQVREIQAAPSLSAPGLAGDAVLSALSGAVYAALLDPDILLVAEDPALPTRHNYTLASSGPALFAPSDLILCRDDHRHPLPADS